VKVLELLRKWDPIGAIDESNQDEYDSYAPAIVRALDAGVSADDLTSHSIRIVVEHMGIPANKKEEGPLLCAGIG
jgi:hypothetical protein